MAALTSQTSVSLLDVLSQRQTQAQEHGTPYLAAVPDADSMLYWLARACKAAREAAARKQVHVAASANVDQSTITRFEKGLAWSRDTDKIVAAYADDLDVPPIWLWQEALRRWQEDQAGTPLSTPEVTERLVREHEKRSGRRRASGPAAGDN